LTESVEETSRNPAQGVWERQAHESSKAFHGFCRYWELGSKRSLAGVTAVLMAEKNPDGRARAGAGATEERKKGKSGQVGLWSRNYKWKERAQEWDAQAALYYEQRRASDYRDMCTRHVKQIRVAQAVIGQFR
jgi:hypothetical protein